MEQVSHRPSVTYDTYLWGDFLLRPPGLPLAHTLLFPSLICVPFLGFLSVSSPHIPSTVTRMATQTTLTYSPIVGVPQYRTPSKDHSLC